MTWGERRAEKKASRALRTAFTGRGVIGLREWLKMGDFLCAPLECEEDMHTYNDRLYTVRLMVGEENMDKLIDYVCKGILELSKNA